MRGISRYSFPAPDVPGGGDWREKPEESPGTSANWSRPPRLIVLSRHERFERLFETEFYPLPLPARSKSSNEGDY